MAHLGLLRVLEEEGIPVDMIVGTSVGAFIGALYAKHASYLEILPYATRFAQNMSNSWLFLKDFTVLPFTSYFNGYSFGRELEKARDFYYIYFLKRRTYIPPPPIQNKTNKTN